MSCEKGALPEPLRYVACVSYPRSGHHLIVRLLKGYFQTRFRYCQFYGSPEGCCGKFPCTNREVTFTKNHDMDLGRSTALGLPKVDGVPYLILVRNFLDAVVSDYNLHLRNVGEDSLAEWQKFAKSKMNYYRRFVQKWVTSDDGIERLVVRYEDLTNGPENVLARIVSFFDPNTPVQVELIHQLVAAAFLEDVRPTTTEVVLNFGVKNRRRVEEFQHYDANFFAGLEQELWSELSPMGYTSRFAA